MPTFPISGHSHLRTGRRSIDGQLYLLTAVTAKRQRLVIDVELARITARKLASEEFWLPGRCLCWVLMPDHLHALVELGKDTNLSTTMQRVKGVTARAVNQHRACHGQVWAKGFHDHALRREEAIENAARYIIANPVRKGLVEDAMDYPYWNAWFLDSEQKHRG